MKSMKIIASFIFISLVLGGCSSVGKTPEPNWRSIKKEGNIEIREYAPMIVAEVTTTEERYEAINDGFRVLAAFIFGENSVEQKIKMTAPVTQQVEQASNKKIAMTAPVTQEETGKDNEWKVRFVMPDEYTLATLPKPNDSRIRILELPSYEAAVIRFSGFNTDKNIASHEKTLREWLENNNVKAIGRPTYAFYNPPWTPPFLRRNEVMFRIAK